MYVGDIDDLDELLELRAEAEHRVELFPNSESAAWDLEDIEDQIALVQQENNVQPTEGD